MKVLIEEKINFDDFLNDEINNYDNDYIYGGRGRGRGFRGRGRWRGRGYRRGVYINGEFRSEKEKKQ